MNTTARPFATLDYVRGFRCLGAECEDNCCHDWDVNLNREHYERWNECFEAGSDERACLEASVRLNPQPDRQRFARVELNVSGACPFLQADGLCRVHRRHGEACLPDTCATYPRVISRRQATVEMAGALSCPEMVRCCFSDEQRGEVVPFSPEELPTGRELPLARILPELPTAPYERHFDAVRRAMVEIVREPGVPFGDRLFRFVEFTHRIAAFYHSDCREPGPQLAQERQRLNTPASREAGVRRRPGGQEEPLAIMVVQALLALRLQRFPEEAFADVVREVLGSFSGEVEPLDPGDAAGVDFPPAPLATAFLGRCARVDGTFGARIEHYLSRYAENCLHREWFIAMPDPYTFAHLLTVRLAVLRFLLYSHPAVLALVDGRSREATDIAPYGELDRTAVRITYRFCRAFDHDLGFQEAVYRALVEQDLLRFELVSDLIWF